MAEAASLLGNVKNDSMFPDLTFKERMYGFAACFIIGNILTLTKFIDQSPLIPSIARVSEITHRYHHFPFYNIPYLILHICRMAH